MFQLARPAGRGISTRSGFSSLLTTVGLCSGKWQAIKAVPCGRWTQVKGARVRYSHVKTGNQERKKRKKIIFICCQLLFFIHLLQFTKKILPSVAKCFELIFSLVLDLACK